MIEALEGRALLATSALDPSFGAGGAVVSPLSSASSDDFGPGTLAVQDDGKIVTAEVNVPYSASPSEVVKIFPVVVRRYEANGTLDTAFGTGGQTVIPFRIAENSYGTAPRNLVITSTGQILLAAEESLSKQDVVVRLTSTGQLDSTFGTGGVFTLPNTITGSTSVLVERSGRIIVGGQILVPTSSYAHPAYEAALLGLTSAGQLDTTFGTAGQVILTGTATPPEIMNTYSVGITGLHLTPTGQILAGVTGFGQSLHGSLTPSRDFSLTRLSADGVIDATFGTNGTLKTIAAGDFAVQPDGGIVLAAAYQLQLARLTADGATDPTFQTPTIPPRVPATPNPIDSLLGFTSVILGTDGSITTVAYTPLNSVGAIARFHADGSVDTTFGRLGVIRLAIPATLLPGNNSRFSVTGDSVALTAGGQILVGGLAGGYQRYLARYLPVTLPRLANLPNITNDYDGDGKSDPSVELLQYGAFATRFGTHDVSHLFGPAGASAADVISAPGDYDGDGITDPALALPGLLAYRPSAGGGDVLIRFGPTGPGETIPAPGDYDGDGQTDVAYYLPGPGSFIVLPSGTGAPYQVQFGAAGTGASIPAPGDYDGDGRTDLAVFLPKLGILAYRGSASGSDTYVAFGPTGVGAAVPVPGDYDGDGKTDVALFLPGNSTFAIRPSGGSSPYPLAFGIAGAGNTVPVPGDYDGDGKTDIAVFLTGSATYAIAPSAGGSAYSLQFGAAGAGNTLPATAVVLSSDTVSAMSLRANASPDPNAGLVFYLPDDAPGRKKPSA